jgi:hypothetical protein
MHLPYYPLLLMCGINHDARELEIEPGHQLFNNIYKRYLVCGQKQVEVQNENINTKRKPS